MYKVVLVDDESIIVEGLRRVVDWSAFHCQVVATAGDAECGMAAIREHSPHILFTDIRMPDRDGLAMVAALRSEYPDMQVCVLTGYRDFEYARQSIRLGVCRFLLKPSRMDEIEEAIRAMTANLSGKGGGGEEESGECAGSFIVRRALEYMAEHHAERLTLQDVADGCYVSQWHLSKLLNRHTGKTFYDLLNGIRVEEAKRLLADPSLKISEIGDRVGYADPGHFARVFKRSVGQSANEYRNSPACDGR